MANAEIKLQDELEGLCIYQLKAGRDFANVKTYTNLIRNKIFDFAAQMRNFVYVIADIDTKECVCWDIAGIMKVIEQHGLHLVGAIITHYHFDHVGGIPPPPFDQLPIRVSGIATLLKKYPHIVGYMHSYDVPFLAQSNPGLPLARIHVTKDNFELKLSERIRLKFIHTPGHTPGSQCILVNNMRIFTGDTLFLGCCGRLDLEGGSERRMFETLNRLRTEMADEVVVYPGHAYGGGEWTTIGEEKLSGALREMTREEWVAKMEAHDEGGSSKRQSLNL